MLFWLKLGIMAVEHERGRAKKKGERKQVCWEMHRGRKRRGENRFLAALTSTAGSRVGDTHTVRAMAATLRLEGVYHACLCTSVCLYCTVCECETRWAHTVKCLIQFRWFFQRGRAWLRSHRWVCYSTQLPGDWQWEENSDTWISSPGELHSYNVSTKWGSSVWALSQIWCSPVSVILNSGHILPAKINFVEI